VIVLDSSAALKAVLPQADKPHFQSLLRKEDCISPSLFLSEIASALWKEVRFNNLSPKIANGLQPLIYDMTEIIPDADLVQEALSIALANEHSVYDCLFIALSRQKNIPILTADEKMKRKFSTDQFIKV